MIAALLVFALGPTPQAFEIEPQRVDWEKLTLFDQRWTLPERSGGRDLEAEMRRLSNLSFQDRGELRRFGDLVGEMRSIERAQRPSWFETLAARAPKLMNDWGEALSQLFLDDHLFSRDWDPAEDHSRDGILTGEGWAPGRSAVGPWKRLEPRFEQAAALYCADLATIKRVENDYATYLGHVGADYLEIGPVPGGHLSGEDESGEPFRFVRIRFRCDLPFPYSSYGCDLRILNCIEAGGILRTDIYSPSSDFNYMAGRDLFLPVRNSAQETVAYLTVRDFGFDIDNVPDRPKHRQKALRSALGNLKRKAERDFQETAEAFPSVQRVLSGLRVLGRE